MAIDYNSIPSPCYVIEEDRLRKNLRQINHIASESGAEFILAFKGFAMWSVFPIVREYISGAAASSLGEARLCHEEMKSPAHTYAPVYDDREFDEILGYSSHITFNSLNQYRKFYPRVLGLGRKISTGLRINPEFSEIAHGLYNPCSPGSRLGITADQLGDDLPEGVEGLHFHVLFESDSYTLERTLAAIEEKFGRFLPKIKWLNMGGGHLVTRKGYDDAHMIKLLRDFRLKHNLHIILEPGSAYGWETGELVATVEDIVENGGIKTAMLNVSFTAHMPDCLEMPYKPAVLGATEPLPGKPAWRLGGNSCLSGDFMGDWSFDRDLVPGDRIVFLDMIHYTMVKTTTFNGVTHPSIGIWQKDGTFRLVRKFCYEDYRNRLS
ncbi:MAG: carboxynorspermidine decarboxylase [Bacteroidales bacterium]|nr:carboxynorspermidine decarboxylase [Bacteroidales bacterium]